VYRTHSRDAQNGVHLVLDSDLAPGLQNAVLFENDFQNRKETVEAQAHCTRRCLRWTLIPTAACVLLLANRSWAAAPEPTDSAEPAPDTAEPEPVDTAGEPPSDGTDTRPDEPAPPDEPAEPPHDAEATQPEPETLPEASSEEDDVLVVPSVFDDEDDEPAAVETPASKDGDAPKDVAQVDVIGRRERALDHIPGSAHVVSTEDLDARLPVSANEILRTVPGVHVRDEEGIGLRPNIGFRGLNPDRSRKILVLEDGIPIALAPYGEPELYYAPAIERMQRMEVVKGSGSILWGPQTIGGVLNYITKDPPDRFTVGAEARAGTYGYIFTDVNVGDTVGPFGYRLSVMHKRFEGHRALNLKATDVSGKFRLRVSSRSFLGLKTQFYDEISNATYLGLTFPQYMNDPGANYAIHDTLPVRRYGLAATHNVLFGQRVLMQTTGYASYVTRNWQRQDFDREFNPSRNYDRIIDGIGREVTATEGPFVDRESVFFRNSTGSRNRAFTVGGVESRTTWDYAIGKRTTGELIGGARLHYEHTSEQRLDGQWGAARSGDLRSDERRSGLALAAFLQNRFIFFDKLGVSPGLRVESFWHDREILRDRIEGVPTDFRPPVSERTSVAAIIPGLGLTYEVAKRTAVFAGVHRGFAPPRTKDAITNDGENLRLAPEFSWNYELGLRSRFTEWVTTEVAGFVLDFSNQVIQPSEAGGAIVAMEDLPELLNGGRSLHYGTELSLTFDPATPAKRFKLPITGNYTWVRATFGDGWNEDWVGNRLPYAPEHMLSGQIRFVHDVGVLVQVDTHYLSRQFSDAGNTIPISPDGTVGRIPARFLLDLRVGYTFPVPKSRLHVYAAGKNLTDERYIASLAPQGIQPGMFRQLFFGIDVAI
jgi:Fe(3+) dicitrate transport protein